MKTYRILVINPGSTSTKIAVFENETCTYEASVFHDTPVLMGFETLNDQLPYRKQLIKEHLESKHIDIRTFDAFVGRGGSSYSMPAGTYEINEKLVEDNRLAKGGSDHPSNLGILLANEFHEEYGGRMFTVDPICVDELCDPARMTGIKGVYRTARFHVLNQRAMAREYASMLGKTIEEVNLIVCHIDGGITVCAHKQGKMIDGNDGAGGDGPYTPTRLGSVAVIDLLDYLRDHTVEDVRNMCTRSGGFASHFNTSDTETVHKRMREGDKQAERVYEGMIYQICKYIGAMSTVLEGNVDGIVLGGGLVRYQDLTDRIRQRCQWIAPVHVFYEEFEHRGLALGALRVLRGEEPAKTYTGIPVFTEFE